MIGKMSKDMSIRPEVLSIWAMFGDYSIGGAICYASPLTRPRESEVESTVIAECHNLEKIIEEGFSPLRRLHAHRLGIRWWMSVRFKNYPITKEKELYFNSFQRLEHGKKGNGRIALKEVCDLADKLEVSFSLEAIAKELFPYYKSFGFVCQKQYLDGVRLYRREPK